MRQIKFRGHTGTDWVYGFLWGSIDPTKEDTTFRAWFIYTGVSIEEGYEVDPKSVGQFTGLMDKNEKEIYEGDILRVDDNYDKYGWASGELCHVLYNQLTARFIMKSKLVGSWSFEGIPAMQQDGVEVLGNIYESPDLLK